ncbi:MAG: RNA polymerase factor sigma-54 [Magnetospirillum sp. WYHS-4]
MVLTPRLDLRQAQTLVMTPQLQQAIKLLQYNNIELTEYVEQELERNPLLLREEEEPPIPGEAGTSPDPGESVDGSERIQRDGLETLDLSRDADIGERQEAALDIDIDNMWNNSEGGPEPAMGAGLGSQAFAEWGGGRGGSFDDSEFNFEQTLSGEENLRDHLIGQLNMGTPDPAERLIGMHLIDMLDEAGYVSGDLEALAEMLGCPLAQVEKMLARLQQFDPAGLFARSLKECLALQLRDRNRLDPAMAALLDNLELLARRDMAGLLKRCGVDAEDLSEMVAEIRALDPKPALAWDHSLPQPVTPDVLMRAKQGGGWIIELNSDTLPRVLVNNHYYSQVTKAARSRDDKSYINECFQTANWLARSLHQRATTILKVATELVRQQEMFFLKGVQHLRPLVLRDIADAIGMHESTVSRVTSNKYISTPRGIYEMKYFFTTAIAHSGGGEAHSAEAVRHRIKALIDAEAAGEILSDDRIVTILKEEGIDIARRTVAKYREGMGIGSSTQRRREKASGI